MSPDAPYRELYALGSPLDSRRIMPSTQSTRSAAQYLATVDLHCSTSRMPPASAGQFVDHCEDVEDEDVLVVVVAAVVGVEPWAFVVVVAGAVVVFVCGGA